MKLWIGKEQEGALKGAATLFVGSPTITYKEIKDVCEKVLYISQIYFGAGICTKLNEDVIRKCLRGSISNFCSLTAEVDINHLHKYNINMLKKLNLIITINHKNTNLIKKLSLIELNTYSNQIKLQNLDGDKSVVGLTNFCFDYINPKSLKGKCYKGDEVIK